MDNNIGNGKIEEDNKKPPLVESHERPGLHNVKLSQLVVFEDFGEWKLKSLPITSVDETSVTAHSEKESCIINYNDAIILTNNKYLVGPNAEAVYQKYEKELLEVLNKK